MFLCSVHNSETVALNSCETHIHLREDSLSTSVLSVTGVDMLPRATSEPRDNANPRIAFFSLSVTTDEYVSTAKQSSVIFVLIYFLVFQLFFRFSFVLVFIIFSFQFCQLFFSFSFVLVLQYFSFQFQFCQQPNNIKPADEDVLMICLNTVHRQSRIQRCTTVAHVSAVLYASTFAE